ncbi:MAG: tRNA (N6-threonylcarbamoyladenosine(37)-N6)-methyltransferase TrmO [Lachnospiraceae bacterium]|nr:tRNA (N6-threonylcarbamoyladenosine(37)-N6)-methyltransferase TrmO [Lachnospiraceae bacterium]
MQIDVIARIKTPFDDKFGIPRQSGLASELPGEIHFEKKYSDMKAVEGLEGFEYIWLIWEFEGVWQEEFRPRIRPPRLGGNEYMGVFATRSPFRPNPLGLSCVRLESIEETPEGPVLHVSGADLRNNTPIYDIKPYVPYVDAHPEAKEGFTAVTKEYSLDVNMDEATASMLETVPENLRAGLIQVLGQDPRPAYHDDPNRVYGMRFGGYEVKFRVENETVYVVSISKE